MTLSALPQSERDELAVTLAALLLHDGGAEITADKINVVLSAAGISGVASYLPGMFASLLAKSKVDDLIASSTAPGGGSSSGAAPAGAAAPAAAGAKKEEKKEEKKAAKEEEVDVGGGDLFGGAKGGKY
jgi:ribosomal protein L12E/L44/L45/RPP1/RPP2